MPRKKRKGAGITQTVLKKTKVISRALKLIGAPGSAMHNFGKVMEQRGYGRKGRKTSLLGRLRLN